MARIVYGLNMSLDGFIDHDRFMPDRVLFRHFIEQTRRVAGSIYGRRMYEIMRYWDDEQPGWGDDEREYAEAWRSNSKWVVSRTLSEVGPNATLVSGDLAAAIGDLKSRLDGELEVAGSELAASLGALGLVDAYQVYIHPAVLGTGKPFFFAPPPPLRLVGSDRIGDNAVRLSYVPA